MARLHRDRKKANVYSTPHHIEHAYTRTLNHNCEFCRRHMSHEGQL